MNQDAGMVFDEQYMMEQNVWAGDARLYVKFYVKAVQNKAKSDEAGRPIFEDKEYIRIYIPGDKNTVIDEPLNDVYKRRFKDRYERWQRETETGIVEGTPLEAVTWLTVSQVAEFKALNIMTVEQLAEVSDSLTHQFMGAQEIKRRAKAFIEAAKGEAANTKLTAELTKRDETIAALQAQVTQLVEASKKAAAQPKA